MGLDVRHRLLYEACVARGSLTGVEVHPREVYRPLIRISAAAVILCDNHPSGIRLRRARTWSSPHACARLVSSAGSRLLDHVVVGAEGYTSLADRGWL